MSTVIEFKPGCLLTTAKPMYKRFRHRCRLTTSNVIWVGETRSQVEWMAYLNGMAEKPLVSWFGRGGDAA